METKLRNFPINAYKSDWDRFAQQEALATAPWHGTESGVFFGWQEGAAGADSSRHRNDRLSEKLMLLILVMQAYRVYRRVQFHHIQECLNPGREHQ
jgi:hypothetical protein